MIEQVIELKVGTKDRNPKLNFFHVKHTEILSMSKSQGPDYEQHFSFVVCLSVLEIPTLKDVFQLEI